MRGRPLERTSHPAWSRLRRRRGRRPPNPLSREPTQRRSFEASGLPLSTCPDRRPTLSTTWRRVKTGRAPHRVAPRLAPLGSTGLTGLEAGDLVALDRELPVGAHRP